MLEKTKDNNIFETVQMPVNVLDKSFFSFTDLVMPDLVKLGVGILAMKTLANGRFFSNKENETNDPVIPNYVSVREALYYSWSLPISVLITGAENPTFLREIYCLLGK